MTIFFYYNHVRLIDFYDIATSFIGLQEERDSGFISKEPGNSDFDKTLHMQKGEGVDR